MVSKYFSTKEVADRAKDSLMSLEKEDFILHDLVLDCIDPRTGKPLVDPSDSTLTRFYKFRKNEIDYDADSSIEANVIYENVFGRIMNRIEKKVIRRQYDNNDLYNKFGLKYELGEPDCRGGVSFRGDTMNSVATTTRAYFWAHKEMHRTRKREDFPWPKEAQNLMDLYHTPGNFMVLPYIKDISINKSRGVGNTRDYFDLFLLAVYNFFLEKNGQTPEEKMSLRYMFNNDERTELFMTYYLMPYINDDMRRFDTIPCQLVDDIEDSSRLIDYVVPGWESFVEKNYLQDFVSTGHYDHYSKPLELWRGHFEEKSIRYALPCQEEEFFEFWENAADRIKKRSARIYDALHKD
ncbi:MAG: hypothetical protein K6G22_06010 [Lachnospiraceae bacterium]|nr:hypothetical protein [Lachnospiraceae bacterium]